MTTNYHEPPSMEEVLRIRAEVYRKFMAMSAEEWANHEREYASRFGLKIASSGPLAQAKSNPVPSLPADSARK